MLCAAITLDTLHNVVHAAVRRLRQCLDADGGHFEHLHWIQNLRTSHISILILYKYSSYDYGVIFFMSKCVYIFWGHSVFHWDKAPSVTEVKIPVFWVNSQAVWHTIGKIDTNSTGVTWRHTPPTAWARLTYKFFYSYSSFSYIQNI